MRRRGFTLIELLVVIAQIGVLIALLLPAVQPGTQQSPFLGPASPRHHGEAGRPRSIDGRWTSSTALLLDREM